MHFHFTVENTLCMNLGSILFSFWSGYITVTAQYHYVIGLKHGSVETTKQDKFLAAESTANVRSSC